MTLAQTPAGWYSDPAARHERRYWDGAQWSSHVLDGTLNSEDPPTEAGTAWAATTAAHPGYRAARMNALRYLAGVTAFVLLLLAWLYEGASYVIALGTSFHVFDEDYLRIFTWLYSNPGSVFSDQYIGRPPILLLVVLTVVVVMSGSTINGTRSEALKKAGAHAVHWLWGSPQDKAQWAFLQARLAAAGVHFTAGARLRNYVFIVVTLVGSLTIAGIAWVAISERSAFDTFGDLVRSLRVGFGPYVCLAAGIAGVIGALAAWPFGRKIVIRADGTIEEPSRG
jgi:Protein of unknown function (DUF2510).